MVGGICAATVPLAKGGFFEGRRHTSNGREWIANIAGNYAGASQYSDVPDAISDARVVSAPGTAPVSFAMAFLSAVYPQAAEMLAGARAMFGAEHIGLTSAPPDRMLSGGVCKCQGRQTKENVHEC